MLPFYIHTWFKYAKKRLYLPCNLALYLLRVRVGGYYIAIIQTTYYPPTPLFHLALKWPAHGRIIRRIRYKFIPFSLFFLKGLQYLSPYVILRSGEIVLVIRIILQVLWKVESNTYLRIELRLYLHVGEESMVFTLWQ